MTRKVHAAQVERFGQPLVLKELDIPTPGAVLADIESQPLSAIHTVFQRLAQGEVPSRLVLDFAA